MTALGIAPEQLIEGAYVDLLAVAPFRRPAGGSRPWPPCPPPCRTARRNG
jgi:hypothetical protein